MIAGIVASRVKVTSAVSGPAVLFLDSFSGSGGVYGRFADEVNCFDSNLSWSEDQDKGFVSGGYLRTTEDSWGSGYYRAWLDVASYGTVANYVEGGITKTLDVDVDAHEILIRVTRITSDTHQCILRWTSGSGSFIGEYTVPVSATIGVPVDVLVAIPALSGVGRYEIDYGIGTGVDYFKITAPTPV